MEKWNTQERPTRTDNSALYAVGISALLLALLFSLELASPTATSGIEISGNSEPAELANPLVSEVGSKAQQDAAPRSRQAGTSTQPGTLQTDNGITLVRAFRKTGVFWGYQVVDAPVNSRVAVGEVILQFNGKAVQVSDAGAALLLIGLNNPDSTIMSVPASASSFTR